jgi:fatty-acyl-CoA synthase
VSVEKPELEFTYNQIQRYSNNFGSYIHETFGLKAKDVIALLMENRVEFPVVTIGMASIGVTSALINFNLTGQLLQHCLTVSNAKVLMISFEQVKTWQTLPSDSFYLDMSKVIVITSDDTEKQEATKLGFNAVNICTLEDKEVLPSLRSGIHERDPFVYIFTSGTTGPSKAAKFSHKRWVGCAVTWAGPCGLNSGDSYYIPLPLYHGNGGAVALSTIFYTGGRAVLRKKFSVSNFFPDCIKFQCKSMIYVGELWRYLASLPERPSDKEHCLRTIVGNGLRSELWEYVVSRFGITKVVEHYGSTEMPGDAVLQWFGKEGSCGFVPREYAHLYSGIIIKYDTENGCPIKKGESVWGVKCEENEPGELIMPLPDGKYDGYVKDEQTEKKLYKNVFGEGDVWFSTGDILKFDQDGFYYFLDRTGDTFRWKGENVSTTEVEKLLSGFKDVKEVNVYGVSIPNTDGKAGMVAIYLKDNAAFDQEKFAVFVKKELPRYAIPLFVRILSVENTKTSTLKFQKAQYAKIGFDTSQIPAEDRIYVYLSGSYQLMTPEMVSKIRNGEIKF